MGDGEVDTLLAQLVKDLPAAKAAAEASRRTGLSKKDLYQRLLDMKDGTRGAP
ncbi:hypothetical protein D3C87_1915130 [compost metagenome]